jgi:putative DNA primase/helicase
LLNFRGAAEIAYRLHGRKSGVGYMACCPAHKDRNPSLSLRDSADGRVLVYCHAGCAQAAAIAALLKLGLWLKNDMVQRSVIAETYDYTDELGLLLYQVVRTEPKGFFQRRPDSHGGWINKKGERQVLYRLNEVIRARIVFVVEGEKDVERLRDQGFVATTNAGGANAPWLPAYTAALRGREVVLIPDNDRPGRQRALRIANALVGQVARLSFFELEGAKDVSDWFDQGHSEVEFIFRLEKQDAD